MVNVAALAAVKHPLPGTGSPYLLYVNSEALNEANVWAIPLS